MSHARQIFPAIVLFLFVFALIFFTKKIYRGQQQGSAALSAPSPNFPESNDVLAEGKYLFGHKCQKCHNIFKTDDHLSPALQKEFWTGSKKIASFLRKPEDFARDEYIISLMKVYGTGMPHIPFRDITDEQVAMIYLYVMTEARTRGY